MIASELALRAETVPDDDHKDHGQEVIQLPCAINPDNGLDEIMPGCFWQM